MCLCVDTPPPRPPRLTQTCVKYHAIRVHGHTCSSWYIYSLSNVENHVNASFHVCKNVRFVSRNLGLLNKNMT